MTLYLLLVIMVLCVVVFLVGLWVAVLCYTQEEQHDSGRQKRGSQKRDRQ